MKTHTYTVIDIETGTVLADRVEDYAGPVAECKTTSTTTVPGPTSEQNRLYSTAADIGDAQLAAIKKQSGFQDLMYQLGPQLTSGSGFSGAFDATSAGGNPVDNELQGLQMNNIRSGGTATPDDISLINQSADAAIASGGSDITAFTKDLFSNMRQELAPQLGLRPDDSPMLDRGGKIATEALRQYGQLVSNTRGAAAQQQLQFPLQRSQAVAGQIGTARSLEEGMQQFQEQLKQQAFANRATLMQTVGSMGLGLSGQQPQFPAIPQGSTTQTKDPMSTISGIGTAMAAASQIFSSKAIKANKRPLDDDATLAALEALPVEQWTYVGDDKIHIGPYAEDFRDSFGVGDGKTINVIDALGVVMSALKALAKRDREPLHV